MPLLKRGPLAQLTPSATTETTFYTCPALATDGARGAWIKVVNRSTATSFRVRIRKNGEADDNKQWVAYDEPIPASGTAGAQNTGVVVIGGLDAGDIIEVYAGSANLTFTLHGEEWQK